MLVFMRPLHAVCMFVYVAPHVRGGERERARMSARSPVYAHRRIDSRSAGPPYLLRSEMKGRMELESEPHPFR